jgi:ABC-type sugar transport system permease subunit
MVTKMKTPEKRRFWQRSNIQKRRAHIGFFFILPWLIGAVAFFAVPMVRSALYAFNDINLTGTGVSYSFKGFDNFIYIFTEDANFLPNLTGAVFGVIYQVPVILVFSLLAAMVLRGKFKGRTLFRAVFFFPVIIASGAVITILREQVMMTASSVTAQQQAYMFTLPAFDGVTRALGLPSFMVSAAKAVVSGFFDITWKSGVQVLLLLAAVTNISQSVYEAADIEGATTWEKLWKITFPLISPTLLVTAIYSIIDSFTDYGNKVMRMITDYFDKGSYEYSTAIGLVYFLTVLLLVGLVNLLLARRVSYVSD